MPPEADDFHSVGEDGLIDLLTRSLRPGPNVVVGPGDDCAVIEIGDPARLGLLKTDCLIEGVHFLPDADPEQVGWKAAARVVSDFAAMGGGQPEHALVTLISPGNRAISWARALYAGIQRCADQFGFGVVGGETSRAEDCVISVSMSGRIERERLVLRSTARIGDGIFVSGELGGAVASGRHLTFEPRIDLARRLVDELEIHSMMDLSDGLARDLSRLAAASGAGFQFDRDAVPRASSCSLESALTEGEDYELLFTAAPDIEIKNLPVTRIGAIVPEGESESLEGGWDHFRSP